MFDKMKQIMEMKKQAERIKRELDSLCVDVKQVPGISICITGSQKFQDIKISDDYFQEGRKDKLEIDLKNSLNAAITQSQQLAASKMKEAMPDLPGM
jgi:DNA-binding protein YbaB